MKEPRTIWTADFPLSEDVVKEVTYCLRSGVPVRIGAACTGHTRAAMVERYSLAFFHDLGAREVKIPYKYMPDFTETYYLMD